MKDFLLSQGIWEKEVNEVLNSFNDDVTKKDLEIVTIFDSAFDLGQNYCEHIIGVWDPHIDAVLDYSLLGEHLAENCEEYLTLSTGRIIEFEL